MKFSFLPKQKWGILSAVLFAAQVLLVACFFVMTGVFHQTGGETFFSNLNLAIPMLAAWSAGLASSLSGWAAILVSKSKSVLVYIIVLITLLTTLYGILAILPL